MPDFNFGGTSDAPISNRPWNEYNSQINKVVIENGVTNVGTNAFRCSVAYSISIPSSIKIIGNDAFRECKNITFAAPEGVVTIGERAFRGCANLKGITIPSCIENVGAGAFYDCTELRNAKFSSNGTPITMGDDVFARCWNLSDVTLPTGIDRISKRMFQNCLVLSELSIPTGVEIIDEGAFSSCSRLVSVFIPKSVTEINMQVFTNCGLTDINYEGNEAEWNAIGKYGDSASILSTIQSNGKVHYNTSVSAELYTVTFNVQEHGTAPAAIDIEAGKTIAKPDDPSADGYIFDGWFKEPECTNAWNFDSDTVDFDIILYVKWIEDTQNPGEQEPDDPNPDGQYTVTFNVQEHGTAPAAIDVEAGEKIAKPNDPSADGYIFDGWFKEPECTNAWNFDSDTVDSDITLYAKWREDTQNPGEQKPDDPNPDEQYTVSFDVQGHGTAPDPVTTEAGKTIAKPGDPSADGYRFEGWYQDAECQNAWNFNTDTVQSNITLYAKWIKNTAEEIENDKDTSRFPAEQRKDLNSVNAEIARINSKVYDGMPYKPTIKVTATDGNKKITLTEGADYRVLYENNINAGTGKVIVRGNGIYDGEITKEFEITKKQIKKLNIVTGGMTADTNSALPVYVYDNTKLLTENTDYVLSEPVFTGKTTAKITVTATIKTPIQSKLQYITPHLTK